MNDKLGIIVLAAGLGKRMKSPYPKVLQTLCEKPLITYTLDLVKKLKPEKVSVVLGYKSELVSPLISNEYNISLQEEQLGTGHAVLQSLDYFKKFDGKVLILCGDVPLLNFSTLKNLIKQFDKNKAEAAILTTELNEPFGYGRIFRNEDGTVNSIVEEKDANNDIKNIKEINSGIYCFSSKLLFRYLPEIKNKNSQNEYYLTDIISIFAKKKFKIIGVKTKNKYEVEGVNSRQQIYEMERKLYLSISNKFLEKGVIIIDKNSTYISPESNIGVGTIIYPNTYIFNSVIGKNNIIKNSFIKNSIIKDDNEIDNSKIISSELVSNIKMNNYNVIEKTKIDKNCIIGANNILKNCYMASNNKIQNNCSIENLQIGKNCTISNGFSVCFFDNINIHKSKIEDNVYFGANCSIVSPIKVETMSYITSGTTIIKDVESNSLVMNRPKTIIKKGYVDKVINKLNVGE